MGLGKEKILGFWPEKKLHGQRPAWEQEEARQVNSANRFLAICEEEWGAQAAEGTGVRRLEIRLMATVRVPLNPF